MLVIGGVRADSLDIKIGQMIMIGMQGKELKPGSRIYNYVKNGTVGGILLYEFNISSRDQLKRLCGGLHDIAPMPLFVSIDQEGGLVNRMKMKYGFPNMSSARSIGLKNDDAYSRFMAGTIARACADVGVNMNYAPVLDLHNASCPVLGAKKRCFSSDPDIVSKIASIYIEEHKNEGVYTVVKHFPGHGSSKSDSHLGVADVSRYWTEKELQPYKDLLANNEIQVVMTAHIINTQLDPSKKPATLSSVIIHDLLREQMGYQGVVISDDMQMGAIAKNYGFRESIKMAILAGVDILMFSNNISGATVYSAENVHSTIKKMVQSGEIPESRINESYGRIMALKHRR